MNRRDFLNQTLLGIMSSYLIGNPLLLGAQGTGRRRARILFIFLRGGSDQILFGQTLEPSTVEHLKRFRGKITIREGNGYPFNPELAIPIDNDPRFVLPAVWEGLFSRNLSGEIPANRIRAPRVPWNGEQVPLDEFFAVRIIQNACNMNFVGNLNFSHDVTQLAAVVMNTVFQSEPGTLARVINYSESNSETNHRGALYFGHAGFSAFEFGDRVIDATPNQKGVDLTQTRSLYTPPVGACRGYYQASAYFRFNGDIVTNEYRTVKGLINRLRSTDSDLARLYNTTYEQLQEIARYADVFSNFRFSNDENEVFMVKRYNNDNNNQITLTEPRFKGFKQAAAYFANDVDFPENIKFAAITIGGWDHHSFLRTGLLELVPELVAGIGGLIYTMAKRSPEDLGNLIIYVLSEFGRSIYETGGEGSDHGYGTNVAAIVGIPPHGERNMWDGRKRKFNKVLGPKLQYRDTDLIRVPASEYEVLDVAPFNRWFILGKVSQQAGLFALLFKLLNVPESRVLNDLTAPFIYKSHASPHGRRLFNEVWQGLPQFES
jgi:uncharacterized protein (DUF1501 family)